MPPNTQRVVIVYDIPNDRRRTKLHKALLTYGTPVQYSVFEGNLTVTERKELFALLKKITKPRQDNVRVYVLCDTCSARSTLFGVAKPVESAAVFIVSD